MSFLPYRPLCSDTLNRVTRHGARRLTSAPLASLTSVLTATLLSSVLLIGCDSKETTESTLDNPPKSTSENTTENTAILPTESKSVAGSATTKQEAQTVSPAGYGGFSFGQTITPDVITNAGLIKGGHGYDECYYLEDPTQAGVKRNDSVFKPIYYQVIDGKLALIKINAPTIKFYTGIQNGDSVDKIITAHPKNLRYSMDKYDQTGDYYHVIYEVPTEVNALPIQIKYTLTGGQKITNADSMTQPIDAWSAAQRAQLQGQVDTIEIGIPDAILLVEGCS